MLLLTSHTLPPSLSAGKAKLEAVRADIEAREAAECVFHPKINTNYRPRSASPAAFHVAGVDPDQIMANVQR